MIRQVFLFKTSEAATTRAAHTTVQKKKSDSNDDDADDDWSDAINNGSGPGSPSSPGDAVVL